MDSAFDRKSQAQIAMLDASPTRRTCPRTSAGLTRTTSASSTAFKIAFLSSGVFAVARLATAPPTHWSSQTHGTAGTTKHNNPTNSSKIPMMGSGFILARLTAPARESSEFLLYLTNASNSFFVVVNAKAVWVAQPLVALFGLPNRFYFVSQLLYPSQRILRGHGANIVLSPSLCQRSPDERLSLNLDRGCCSCHAVPPYADAPFPFNRS